MRQIKFRGQDIETGEWLYGDLIQRMGYMPSVMFPYESNSKVHYSECAVKRETVGQFTGLTDKNGKEIYEGDIVKCNNGVFSFKGIVQWDKVNPSMCISSIDPYYIEYDFVKCGLMVIEVIGNIHDNPEILKNE